ncbi:MAG: hypothetical protein ACYS21_12855, partial [Planctomycetota bacterium]
DPFGDGSVRVLDQTTGEALGTIQPAGTKWHTLTFSGTGSNDTRLFMAKEDDVDIADIIISEIDSAGNTVVGQDTSLKAIFASSAIPYPADHGDVGCWNMRYSQSHDSLFLAVNPHQSNAVQDQATIHEINLELDTVLNTYQAGLIDDSALVYIDIDGHNDRIYVGAKTLVSANSGIVAVDTPGGALTTLIDGSRAGGLWSTNPFSGLVFRNNNNPENAKTLMVVFGPPPGAQYPAATLSPVSEYYLDQVDGNGDLLLRQEEAYQSVRYPGTAQLDEVEGTTMQVRYVKEQGSMRNAGIDQYTAEDVHYRPPRDDAVNQELLHSGWEEVDSPGFNAIGVVPVAEQYALGYEGDASTPSSFDYVVRNKGYSGNISYTVAEDVDEPWLTLSKAGGGPIAPGTADSAVTALIDSTSLTAGFYTANLIFTDVNDSTNVFVRTITVEVKECGWTVKPETTQSSKIEADMTVFGRCTDPTSYDFTVTSLGGADVSYTVDEVLSDGVTGTDYDWLDLAKAGGGPIPSGSYDTLTVTVTSDDTDKTAYLRFTPSCGISSTGVGPVVRRIDVTRLVTSDLGEKAFKHAYLGDVDPMAVDSCGVGCTFEIHTAVNSKNEAVGTVVADGEAQNGTAFYVSTAVTGRHGYQSHTTDATHTDVRDFISGKLGFTMVARLKVHVNQNASGLIWAWSNSRSNADPVRNYPKCGYNMTWGGNGPSVPGKVREYQLTAPPFDDINDRTSAVLADSTERLEYQVIRIVNGFGTYGDRTLAVYYNEQPDPVLFLDEGVLSGTQSTGTHDSFCFGTFGASASAEVWYDWISFTNQGMYAPGEEVDC